jgi:hypothetical protein
MQGAARRASFLETIMSALGQTPKSVSAALMFNLAPRADIAEFIARVGSGPFPGMPVSYYGGRVGHVTAAS